jgi:hypothetical protein
VTQQPQLAPNQIPVLIYVPGLGTSAENTADVVADVIAESADLRDPQGKYTAQTAFDVVSPTGLTVSKKVSAPDGNTVLQLFEFNYRPALDESTTPFAPSAGPSAIKAVTMAVEAAVKWGAAARQPGKGKAVKVQLLGLGALVLALLAAALFAVAALLVALGVPLGWFAQVLGTEEQAGRWTFGIAAFGTITWAALRKKILGLATLSEAMVNFVDNDNQLADNISRRLAKAINDLTDAGWVGPIHLLGYSFGSLIVYETMFPRTTSMADTVPAGAVKTLTTIGCPLDIVRLYEPDYVGDRTPSRVGIPWKNVFNPADLLSSNLMNGTDSAEGASNALDTGSVKPESVRYLKEDIGVVGILKTGRMHSNYWGEVRAEPSSNCFNPLINAWIPARPPATVQS